MPGSERGVRVAKWLGAATLALVACGRTNSGNPQAGATGGSGGAGDESGVETGAGAGAGPTETIDFPGYSLGAAIYTRAQRLTNSQFQHAVIDILGLPATTNLEAGLVDPPANITTFDNNEQVLVMDQVATPAFEEAVEKAAALATESEAALARLYPAADAPGFVRHLGRRAFRRPLSSEEVTRFTKIFARGEELYGAGFAHGAALVIRAMLQSPSFLYRTELGPAGSPLGGYEVAAKLSFWLLDTTPSDALLDAAAAGELDDVERLVATARAMLEQPAASGMMRDFHGQLYRLTRFDDPKGQPALEPSLAAEAKEASLRFFERLFEGGLGVRDIFTSTRGFVGPKLAPLYSQPAPAGLEERELGPARVGYFMQVPPLMHAFPDGEPNVFRRAINVVTQTTCAIVGSPVFDVDFPPIPALKPGQSNRQRLEEHTSSCGASCHGFFDPLGFAFDGFDGMGAARDTDGGQPIDTSGTFPFSDGSRAFADAKELSLKLADDDHVYACYGLRLASYGLQRDLVTDDAVLIEDLAGAAREGTLKDLTLSLVRHPAFRLRHEDLP